MIANFFNKTKPINFLVLAIMMFIVYLISISFAFSEELSITYFLNKSFYLVLVIFMLFTLNFIISKNMLTDRNSYAMLFYILIFGFFPFSFENTELLAANFFLLISFRRIYSLRTPNDIQKKIFDSSFWIGIASLFSTWSFIFIFFVYAGILIFRKNDWKYVFIPIIGFITPVFLVYTYFLAWNDLDFFYNIWDWSINSTFQNYSEPHYLVPILFILILGIVSILPTTRKALMAKQDVKLTWNALIFHILLSFFLVLIAPLKDGSEFIFLAFPLSILFANYLQLIERNWLKEVLVYLFIGTYLSVYIM